MPFPLLSLITFLPLIFALIVLVLPNAKTIKTTSILLSLIPLALSVYLWISLGDNAGKPIGTGFHEGPVDWIVLSGEAGKNIQYYLAVDGISVPLIFLTTLLTTLGLFYSSRVINDRVREFFFLFLLLETGMLGVFVSMDLFLFYVFWEIGLLPMYFLIGIWGHAEDRPQYSAIKFFLYTLAGSVLMLLAIIAVYLDKGTFSIPRLMAGRPFADNGVLAAMAFTGFFLAFSIKVPLWPFHTWLPDAHTAAPTAGSVILAGVLLKLGTYGYVRILMPVFPTVFQLWAPFIAILATLSIVYGALVAMAQTDFKRLIAYTSVNHMGFVILGLAAAAWNLPLGKDLVNSAAIAVNGATLEMFAHGIITGALFFLVGMLYERTHTRDLTEFGGLGAKVPTYAGLLILAVFASLGLPGLASFVAEFMIFRGAYALISTVIVVIAISGVLINAALFLWKVIQKVLLGTLSEKWAHDSDHLKDLEPFEVWTLAPLAALMLVIGLYPQWLIDTINAASVTILTGIK